MRNRHGEARPFRVRNELEGTVFQTVDVPANETKLQRVYVITPPRADPAQTNATPVRFWVEDLTNGERAYKDSTFNGQEGSQ